MVLSATAASTPQWYLSITAHNSLPSMAVTNTSNRNCLRASLSVFGMSATLPLAIHQRFTREHRDPDQIPDFIIVGAPHLLHLLSAQGAILALSGSETRLLVADDHWVTPQ